MSFNQLLIQTSWWVPCYGWIGAVITLPWAVGAVRRTGPRPAAYFNLFMTILSLAHSCLLLNAVWDQPPVKLVLTWLKVADLDLSIAIDISSVSSGAAVLVGGISLLAQIYALGYMEIDWGMARFFALVGFFEAAMSGIALSDSLFLSYALLELLTLSTYLLVGFWYAQPLVVSAARDAFWTKRIGDLFLLMGVVALSSIAGSLNFSDLTDWANSPATLNFAADHPEQITLLGLALIAGPIGKCAQFPLQLWLDEAMEGPNPASILRNSVVVACGALVLIKLEPILALSPLTLSALVTLGTITAIGTSLVAIAQIDLKRALAHSTSAYLGLVFIAVGMQQNEVAIAFLFTHAIARALLFMSTGAVMVVTYTQDITEMGGLWSRLPATGTAFVVGSLGLIGLLPLGNFWTMLAWLDRIQMTSSPGLVVVLFLVNGITAFGLTRLFDLVFLGSVQPKTRRAAEVPWLMAVPIVSLTIITLLVPVMLYNWGVLPSWRTLDWEAAGVLALSGAIGFGVGAKIYIWPDRSTTVPLPSKPVRLTLKFMQNLLSKDLYIMEIYRFTVILIVGQSSKLVSWIDRNIVDNFVNFLGFASILTGETLRYTVTGRSQQYVLTILLGMILVGILTFLFSAS